MILQALYEYYQRKADLPREGFENKEFKFIIVIKKDGTFVDLIDKREGKRGKEYLVPKAMGRSGSNSWQITSLLWDHYGYVLEYPKDSSDKSMEMAKKQNIVFVNTIKSLPDEIKQDEGVSAVLSFYEREQKAEVKKHPNWDDCSKIKGCNLTFQLDGDNNLIPQRKIVHDYQASISSKSNVNNNDGDEDNSSLEAMCLITGNRNFIARTHSATPIKGSKSNAKLVSFQKNMGFDSYNKEQALNAPISISAESSYTTALKYLINSPSNKVFIADSTTIFWSEKESTSFNLEKELPWYISDSPKDDPDRGVNAVKALYNSIHSGQLPREKNNRFYILGLSPNAARIAVRFWRVGTVWEIGEKIKNHFDDIEMIKAAYERDYCTLNELLVSIGVETKDRKKPNIIYFKGRYYEVPPNLAGSVITSILDGSQYPSTLLQQCIRRIRAEVSKKDNKGKLLNNVTRPRAAILKAYLNRINRTNNQNIKEVNMALDKENTEVGYVLGRLFALLEKVQEESAKPIRLNSTIRERYYASFSSSPIVVMPLLLKLKNHHMAKLSGGLKNWFETEIKQVVDLLKPAEIPGHLTLEQQALFAVGYYHQKNHQ